MNEDLKVGKKITVRYSSHSRTPQWLDGYDGEIVKLNSKSVTIKVDEYPKELHRVSYKDIRKRGTDNAEQ